MLPNPPRLIEDARMLEVARWLRSVGYRWPEIAKRAGLVDHVHLRTKHHSFCLEEAAATSKGTPINGIHDCLVRLFFLGLKVPETIFREHVPESVAASLEEMGLIVRQEGAVDGPFALLEYDDIYTVSDGTKGRADDWVLLPSNDSYAFSTTITRRPGDRFLDIGTGCGILTLRAASSHREAIGVDITARSVAFSRFNQRLNGISNARFVQGDIYAPVEGKFDVIVSNPPYVPHIDQTDEKRPTYYQGGRHGDIITREVLAGLVTHLNEGGYCNILGLTLYWEDGSTNPGWHDLTGYDIVLLNTVVPIDNLTIVGPKLLKLLQVGAKRVEFGTCVLRKHTGPKRPGWFVRGPWLEKLDFDIHDLFEELAGAPSEDGRQAIARRYFEGK